jgi:hypothetical protein
MTQTDLPDRRITPTRGTPAGRAFAGGAGPPTDADPHRHPHPPALSRPIVPVLLRPSHTKPSCPHLPAAPEANSRGHASNASQTSEKKPNASQEWPFCAAWPQRRCHRQVARSRRSGSICLDEKAAQQLPLRRSPLAEHGRLCTPVHTACIGNALISACAVNRPPGQRARPGTPGWRSVTECSFWRAATAVWSGYQNAHSGGSARVLPDLVHHSASPSIDVVGAA